VRLCVVVYILYIILCAIVYTCVRLCAVVYDCMRREFMTEGNAYGMAILRRFLFDDIMDFHIRPLLLDAFPFWRIKPDSRLSYGYKISLHLHAKTTYLDCVHNGIFDWISEHYNKAPVAPTIIDMFAYVERDTTNKMWRSYRGQFDQIASRLTMDNPRIHFVNARCVHSIVHKSKEK